ncbi:MAG: hypothetical protein BWX71_01560 [Deltaproteobacteria bacterium ADurb.Bin072]|nr:MAG: hypothetical protein BWX71_01560 [Deltaproteobacteria bacterium ADurb.Bin072]
MTKAAGEDTVTARIARRPGFREKSRPLMARSFHDTSSSAWTLSTEAKSATRTSPVKRAWRVRPSCLAIRRLPVVASVPLLMRPGIFSTNKGWTHAGWNPSREMLFSAVRGFMVNEVPRERRPVSLREQATSIVPPPRPSVVMPRAVTERPFAAIRTRELPESSV